MVVFFFNNFVLLKLTQLLINEFSYNGYYVYLYEYVELRVVDFARFTVLFTS